jgi:hypothetical protein
MFIDNDTKKRVNINAPYKGFSRLETPEQLAAANVVEIAEPNPPADYDADTYYRTEQDDAPYVVYTRKNDEQIQQIMLGKFITAMEAHYDSVARDKKYDNRLTCALRAGYAGPFQLEGQAFAIWMDNCNAYGYLEMAKVLNGTRQMPTVEQLISELPSAPW